MAIIFTTNADPAYTTRHQFMAKDELEGIRKIFKKKKFHVKNVSLSGKLIYMPKLGEDQWVPNKKEIAKYLARPSTKAIAFFGHGGECVKMSTIPGFSKYCSKYKPSLGADNTAARLRVIVCNATAINYYNLYKNKGISYQEALKMAFQKIWAPNWDCDLEYAYIHACNSLNDKSMCNFLIHNGGTYWGDKGILWAILDLTEVTKP